MCAPCATTASAAVPGAVEPHFSLMLVPLGDTPTGITSAPSSHSTSGAAR